MPSAYIITAKRSPFVKARSKDPAFYGMHPIDLASYVAKKTFEEVSSRTSLKTEHINDVICGLVTKVGKQAFNPGRLIAIKAFGEGIPGKTVDRQCGSSLEALNDATRTIKTGDADIVVVVGLEDMKEVPIGSELLPQPSNFGNIWKVITKGPKSIHDSLPDWYKLTLMPESGKLVAKKYNLTRKDLDEYAARSQNRAYETREKGYFKSEIIPIPTSGGVIDKDDGVRKSNAETLNKLQTISKENEYITAANASQLTTGASCIILASEKALSKFGLKPQVEVIANTICAVDPNVQLDGPVFAIPKVLEKANLKKEEIDRFEINEAFASVPLACIKTLNLDENKVNAQGGAIALGHPLGASGARLIVTLVHQLQREKLNYGLATLCIGGGQANATIIKRI